jgi:hypothetical protein
MSLRGHFQTTACAAVLLIGVQRTLDDAFYASLFDAFVMRKRITYKVQS